MYADIVGRQAELRAVAGFLDSVDARPAALLLEGEAGIGKTTLWLATVEQARGRGFHVLVARPAAAEAVLSYASLADLLADVASSVLQTLPEPQRRAIDVVLLRGGIDGMAADRRATGAALLSVLERLADEAPVLLAIDDLQWVDTSSVAAIEFAARRLSSRVGVLAALRTGEPDDPGPSLRLLGLDGTQHVRVGPLSLGALHGVLRERIGRSFPRPTMVRIEQVSGGNPFYALELARGIGIGGATDLTSPLPGSVAQLVQARIEGVPAIVQRVLLAVAALAEPTVELVQVVVCADPAEGDHLVEDAERTGLVRVDGHRVRFTHPLLATGVYASATPAGRRAMHRRLAEVVSDLEERGRHLALAAVRADSETISTLDRAAVRARSRGAPAAAAELVDLAVGLGADTPDRRILSAQHHFDAGDPMRARSMLEEVVNGAEPGETRAMALLLLATVRLHDDSYREAAGYLQQALDEAVGNL
ncbi:MAG TPA: AAA family ATPase, partial [Mycobacterium sp.]|nr:AAA family ATPase [Mycobacterium sp.]